MFAQQVYVNVGDSNGTADEFKRCCTPLSKTSLNWIRAHPLPSDGSHNLILVCRRCGAGETRVYSYPPVIVVKGHPAGTNTLVCNAATNAATFAQGPIT